MFIFPIKFDCGEGSDVYSGLESKRDPGSFHDGTHQMYDEWILKMNWALLRKMFKLTIKQQMYAMLLFTKTKDKNQYFQRLSSNETITTNKKFWNAVKLFVTNKEKLLQLH